MPKAIRVLLIEDREDNATLIRMFLRRSTTRAFTVKWCKDLENGIQCATAADVDVVLLDLNLPDSGGVGTVRRFRAARPNLPIVIVSSVDDDEVFFKAMRQGAQDYLVKGDLSPDLLSRAIVYAINRRQDEAELDRSHGALRELALHLQNIREEERGRISRDIHDRLGQALTALRIDQSRVEGYLRGMRNGDNVSWAVEKLHDMAGLIDETVQTVRDITAQLRPGILDDIGLGAAMEWETNMFAKRTGIACDIDVSALPEDVGEPLATQVYRIFQEVLTNVARHAEASAIRTRIAIDEEHYRIEVIDNGRGISTEDVRDTSSLGILGMRERALSIGASIEFTGTPGEGSRVTLTLPRGALEQVSGAEAVE